MITATVIVAVGKIAPQKIRELRVLGQVDALVENCF